MGDVDGGTLAGSCVRRQLARRGDEGEGGKQVLEEGGLSGGRVGGRIEFILQCFKFYWVLKKSCRFARVASRVWSYFWEAAVGHGYCKLAFA